MPRNFGIVTESLLRSGRMSAKDLRVMRDRFKVSHIIDFRDREPLFRPITYERIGLVFRSAPMDENQPIAESFARQLFAEIAGHTTWLHCWKGSHRTGAIVALYRKLIQQWPPENVWREMQSYGFGAPEKHPALFKSVFTHDFTL